MINFKSSFDKEIVSLSLNNKKIFQKIEEGSIHELKESKYEYEEAIEPETRECTNPEISSIESVKVSNCEKARTELFHCDETKSSISFTTFIKENKKVKEKICNENPNIKKTVKSKKDNKTNKKKKRRKHFNPKLGDENLKKRKKTKQFSESIPKKNKMKKKKSILGGKIQTNFYTEKFFSIIKETNSNFEKKKENKEEKLNISERIKEIRNVNQSMKKTKDFLDDFEIGKRIGKGATSVVRKIIRKSDGVCYAMKSFKNSKRWPTPANEGHILDQLHHPNIVEFIRFYRAKGNVSCF